MDTVKISKVKCCDRTFHLIDDLVVDVSQEGGYFIVSNEDFGIYGFAETEQSAARDFCESFCATYDSICLPNQKLTLDAVVLKEKILSRVSHVEETTS